MPVIVSWSSSPLLPQAINVMIVEAIASHCRDRATMTAPR
jgi:hypothetical protein